MWAAKPWLEKMEIHSCEFIDRTQTPESPKGLEKLFKNRQLDITTNLDLLRIVTPFLSKEDTVIR